MEAWYSNLAQVKLRILETSPELKCMFDDVDRSGFLLHTMYKEPYTALICAIIGQKITYKRAKTLRGELYTRYGNILTPETILNGDLSFLDSRMVSIIRAVTHHIITENVVLNKEGIKSLTCVSGIGPWTVNTTLLTSFLDWDIYPHGDKFLRARVIKIYGKDCDVSSVVNSWSPYRSIVTWYMWRWF